MVSTTLRKYDDSRIGEKNLWDCDKQTHILY
ncbi:Uncharacterised protein [Serratia fonticola]|nr:Uncharacterised protein [Serratia fonticola]